MASHPRTRDRVNVPLTQVNLVKDCALGCTSSTPGPATIAWDNESISDWVTENYKQLISDGHIINNPCSYERDALETVGSAIHNYDDGVVVYQTSGALTCLLVDLLFLPPGPTNTIDEVERRCKMVALANIDSTPFAFGEDSLELKETLRFLRNPINGLLGLSRKFRKVLRKRTRNKTSAYELLQAHGKLWLEYQFALSPLIRSLMDALDAYQSEPPDLPPRLTSRGISVSEDSGTNVAEGLGLYEFKQTLDSTRKGKATILYQVTNPVYDWRYRLGFRPKDFPTTVWQIMPYSFMVDRALDLTSFLKGAINLGDPMVKILMACYSQHDDIVSSAQLTGRNHVNSDITQTDVRVRTNHKYVRVPWVPSFSDTVPELNLGGLTESATKMLDLLALILGNFSPINRKEN